MTDTATIAYIPHGGGPLPLMDTPGHARLVRFLTDYPATIDKPEAIVVISAHWEEPDIAITAAEAPPLLFDYYGFPPETYQYSYPAAGDPQLAGEMQQLLQQAGIAARLDGERGFDHGLFVPLMLMYPDADIPCVQLSLSASLDARLHVQIGKALAALRGRRLLLLGSGFSFHNMEALMRGPREDDVARNRAFEDWLADTCCAPGLDEKEREQLLVNWQQAPHARFIHPREEHLLPLQVCYGLAQGAATRVFHEPVEGFLTSAYQWG